MEKIRSRSNGLDRSLIEDRDLELGCNKEQSVDVVAQEDYEAQED